MNNSTIKNNIEKLRKRENLSQEEVAEKLGISTTAYRKIEKGDTSLISSRLSQLSSVFNTTEEEIIFGYKTYNKLVEEQIALVKDEYAQKESIEIRRLKEIISKLQEENNQLKAWLDDKEVIIRMMRAKK